MKDTSKDTIIVIPAFNEEKNIGNVIKEIKTDMKDADVLVVDDCSKDKTREIVLKNQVKCISLPFNMGYSRAVQTGIKYANIYGYEYVICFDADGQHIAKEAKKLKEKIVEENCDLVIGSRYLIKDNFKQSFFRKLGTNMFRSCIKLFCKQEITDPLSGFQCFNRKLIQKFSEIYQYPDANLIIELIYEGYMIKEVPVKMRLREFGESMHGGILKPIKYMLSMFYTIFIIIIRNCFRKK